MTGVVATEEASRLTQPFEQPIEPVRVSLPYRLGLVLVAVAMVLLPLIYVGLIVLVSWGLYWHVTDNVAIFDAMSGGRGSGRAAAFVYVMPIVVGSILILFMIKPIFARRPKTASPVSLDPAEEPMLFAFVERLCAAVGAPRPRRIDVDHQVNASASFRRGMWSLLRQDLVLTIGLPLVAGLTLRELAGVLAHEFGHFAQGTGMRVTFIIRSVNYWFARVVYERDAWDVRLHRWSEQTDWRLAIILYIARFFVWLTRRALWALMMAGHAISCFMLRNMEFDADRYEARVAGSEAFEATVYRLQELNAASQQAFASLERSWRSGQLADDLPALVQLNLKRLPEQVGVAIQEHVRESRTGTFDTHPADRDRIESARREEADGVFRLQEAATRLFRDFEALCKRVTTVFYSQQLGREVPASHLVPTTTLVLGEQDLQASMQVLLRYFMGAVPIPPGPRLPAAEDLTLPEDARGAYRELQEARRLVEAGGGEALQRIERRRQWERQAIQAAQALGLMQAGYGIRPEDFGLRGATTDEAGGVLERASAEARAAAGENGEYGSAVRRRLELALRLIQHPQARTRLEDVDAALAEIRGLVAVLAALRPVFDRIEEPRRAVASLSVLLHAVQNNEATDTVGGCIRSLSEELVGWLEHLRRQCNVRHPFDGGHEITTVADHLVEELPSADEVGEVHRHSSEAMDRLYSLYHRALASLIGVAARVEGALGMPPLPEIEGKERRSDAGD
jgi:Zn-dependent protease with chaperone function